MNNSSCFYSEPNSIHYRLSEIKSFLVSNPPRVKDAADALDRVINTICQMPVNTSADTAADLLCVSTSTLWRLTKNGSIPTVKLGGRRLYPLRDIYAKICNGQIIISGQFRDKALNKIEKYLDTEFKRCIFAESLTNNGFILPNS